MFGWIELLIFHPQLGKRCMNSGCISIVIVFRMSVTSEFEYLTNAPYCKPSEGLKLNSAYSIPELLCSIA